VLVAVASGALATGFVSLSSDGVEVGGGGPVGDAIGSDGNDTDAGGGGGGSGQLAGGDGDDVGPPTDAFTPPVDAAGIREAHAARLDESGTFTFEQRSQLRSDDVESLPPARTLTVRVDLGRDRLLAESVTGERRSVAYRDGTERYERVEDGSGDVEYRTPSDSLQPDFMLEPSLLRDLGNVTLAHEERADGHAYTASGVDALSGSVLGVPRADVTDLELSVVVTDGGRLESYSYTVGIEQDDGATYSASVTAEFTEVGSTDVDEPAWLDEARAATA
jgi:hypothetical protein